MLQPLEQTKIRLATLADVPQLCRLLTLLFAQEADFTPNVDRQTRGLHMIIEKPEIGRIYCAAREALIVGMVSILYTVSTAEGGRAAWMEDMVVHPDWRGHRIGEQLLQLAVEKAREAGCTRITLLTDADNGAAIRFYSRAGFTRSSMIPLRLKL
jgi:ribosomal protein S18 acetylase RimI-like enzyme